MSEGTPNRKAVTRSVTIAASPARTFQALIDPHDLKRWWGANEAVIAPRNGGVWSLGWHAYGQDNFYTTSASIQRIAHARELRMTNVMYFRPDMKPLGPMRLSFHLRKKGKSTVLTVRQTGYGKGKHWDWYYQSVQNGWEESLWNLKRYLERRVKHRSARRA
jgi:uncharacterized protein YndB with AHSA1/START domain